MNINFQENYSRDNYLNWFKTFFLPDDFETAFQPISPDFKTSYVKSVQLLGQCDSLELSVYEITHQSENDPRVSLSKETFRLMADLLVKNALVLFVSESSANYRLSLTTLEFKLDNGKITRQFSNPRRYSFFLGPDCKAYTPSQCLIKKGRVKDFKDLSERFSVEVVNKEFYHQIALLFSELVGGERKLGSKKVKLPGIMQLPGLSRHEQNHQKYQEFAVRLIGRLVFCWFLKKKSSPGGIPLIDEAYLSSLAVENNEFYYHNVLENLFFQVLNKPTEDRSTFLQEYFAHTPFLNGGLFEPHHDDFYAPNNMLVSNYINTLKIPDEWFKKLFAVFETYNFTIDENTTIDIELSIDPEMLGRIFENLLAEINPETGETARKATGSYYTPRPIVEYMVDESLKQYLKTQTGIAEDRLAPLLSYSEEIELSVDEKNKIIEALEKIKVLDLACGSGAFPMGMLQKMLLILQRVDPRAEHSLQKVLAEIKDPTLRQLMKQKLTGDQDLWDYTRKLSLVQNALYGVDIQPIAVEISMLRFFLSLIVDEKVNDNQTNRGVHALPNLEFKFVAANTLIGLPEKQQTLEEATDEAINKLKRLREDYFTSYGHWKQRIEDEYRQLQKQMAKRVTGWGTSETLSFKLTEWDPFSHDAAQFFDPEWMFGIREGFDVVIGNPPYGAIATFPKEINKLLSKQNYQTYSKNSDIYCLFFEKGINLTRNKGILSYISSNRFCFTNYGVGLRKYLSLKNILQLINFNEINVFESANVGSIVTFIENDKPADKNIFVNEVKGELNLELIPSAGRKIDRRYYQENQWSFDENKAQRLKQKIESKGIPFIKLKGVSINRGITTGLNDVFIISDQKRIELINDHSSSKEIIRSVLKGANIKRYNIIEPKQFLIYTYAGIEIERYPAIYNYLKKHRNKLEKVYEAKHGQKKWFELRKCNYYDKFSFKKLVWTRLSNINAFAISNNGEFTVDSSSFAISDDINIEFLAAILNSKVVFFYFKLGSVIWGKDGIKWFGKHFDNIPIPQISKHEQLPFITLVSRILTITKADDYLQNPQK